MMSRPGRAARAAPVLLLAFGACAAPRQMRPPRAPEPAIVNTTVSIPLPEPTPIAVPEPVPLEVVEGEATYYASFFDGRPTASGITFDNDEYYAAHRTYPFGTVLRVTNLQNERSVTVTVVDRGPHGASENIRATVIDVSQRAADELDFITAGRTRVRVEVLAWGS